MVELAQSLRGPWRLSWRSLVDAGAMLGLVLAVVASSLLTQAEAHLTVVSAACGLAIWYFVEPRQLRIKRLVSRTFLVPLLSACATLLLLAAAREPYSGTYLLLYVLLWTGALLVSRFVAFAKAAPLKVLLVGESPYWLELRRLPGLEVERRAQPPDSVLGWDLVALDVSIPQSPAWLAWLAHADMAHLPVINAHKLTEELSGKVTVDTLVGRWAAEVFRGNASYQLLKRAFDLSVVLLCAPLLLLACALIALLVYADGGRPVLFWQERIGRGGRVFRMVKFRTMRRDAEASGSAFAAVGDLRVTRLGQLLRKFRLDELPQFWNVLRGEMSIIGPRPEQVPFVAAFEAAIPLYHLRHNVAPGITGWAQVRQGYAAGQDETLEKLRHDFYYIKHLSLWMDVRVVIRTVYTVMTGFGAR